MPRAVLILASCLVAHPALAQQRCDSFAAVRIGMERGSAATLLAHELLERLAEARRVCEEAAKHGPKNGATLGRLARVRALSGDAAGALEAARAGAALGSPVAQAILGVFLAQSPSAPPDHALALEQFRLAQRGGSPYGSFNLGVMLANGRGAPRHEADAAAQFGRAARSGDTLAMQVLAQRFDRAGAAEWLQKAAEAMQTEAPRDPLRLSELGAAAPDPAALVAWYARRANAGRAWAQAYLGLLAEAGQWMPRDLAAAAAWYRLAAEAGHVPAQVRLARMYREGRGVPRDEAQARYWNERPLVQRCEALERAAPPVHACDRLAAERYDPQRVAEGVDSDCMRRNAERAVVACTAAVKASPGTARYRAQLARALAHTGRMDEARREARAAADAGSSAAMVLLGAMSARGFGAAKDDAEAAAWYAKAADAGNERGMALAGRQIVRAAPSLRERAEKGDPRAQHTLAAELEREKRYAEAHAWYQRAAAKGFGVSALNLAQSYETGIGVAQDVAEARRRYRRLAAAGNGEARWRAARLAAEAREYKEAVDLYGRGARDGDSRAMLDLGQMHEEGRGVPKSIHRALELYERAAALESNWARAKVGALYLQGAEGLAPDYAKALEHLRRAAGAGHGGSRNNLGVMFERGMGVKADLATARELYVEAAGQGNAHARGNAEALFASGRGAPKGPAALDWYLGGAQAGVAAAQYRVGRMYARGEDAPKDDKAALEWLLKAARQGHPQARAEAAELLYRAGEDMAAAELGHSRAANRVAARIAASGKPAEAAAFRAQLAALRPPPPPVYPSGVDLDPGKDFARDTPVRIAGLGLAEAAAGDAAIANVYDIIRWFPPK